MSKPHVKIKICWSDGDPSTWPTQEMQDPTPNADGSYSYFRPIEHDEQRNRDYRIKVGRYIMENSLADTLGYDFMLSALPKGFVQDFLHFNSRYKLFELCTAKPGPTKKRVDTCLFGRPGNKRYRSTQEFSPHLLWLASDVTRNYSNCACLHCQREDRSNRKSSILPANLAMGKSDSLAERRGDVEGYGRTFRAGEMVHFVSHGGSLPCIVVDGHIGLNLIFFDRSVMEDVGADRLVPFRSQPSVDDEASRVGTSWMPFDPAETYDGMESFNGLWLGAEKIWRGEGVRLKPRPGDYEHEVLVIERMFIDGTGAVGISGDIYVPTHTPPLQATRQPPEVMRAVAHWTMKNPADEEYVASVYEIAGRWYPQDFGPLRDADISMRIQNRRDVYGHLLGNSNGAGAGKRAHEDIDEGMGKRQRTFQV